LSSSILAKTTKISESNGAIRKDALISSSEKIGDELNEISEKHNELAEDVVKKTKHFLGTVSNHIKSCEILLNDYKKKLILLKKWTCTCIVRDFIKDLLEYVEETKTFLPNINSYYYISKDYNYRIHNCEATEKAVEVAVKTEPDLFGDISECLKSYAKNHKNIRKVIPKRQYTKVTLGQSSEKMIDDSIRFITEKDDSQMIHNQFINTQVTSSDIDRHVKEIDGMVIDPTLINQSSTISSSSSLTNSLTSSSASSSASKVSYSDMAKKEKGNSKSKGSGKT